MNRETDTSEGTGAILAVVAVAALIILGMLYIMQPLGDTPATSTAEQPAIVSPSNADTPAQKEPSPN
jgi:hypothetical protein